MFSGDNEEEKFKKDVAKFFEHIYQTKENSTFKIDHIEMAPCCQSGENFVGEVFKLTLIGIYLQNAKKLSTLTKNLVIKKIPSINSVRHTLYNIPKMFENEITFYESILPLFQSHAVKIFPAYYGRGDNFIALEDLLAKGYKMTDRFQGLNFQECKMVLRELAHFHATSFVLQRAKDEIFHNGLSSLQEVVFCPEYFNKPLEIIWENSLKFAIKSLQFSNDLKLQQTIQNIKKYSGQIFNHLIMITKPTRKFGVICHGDLWSNNIMIKYNENNTPAGVKLLDLQAARHSSCTLDVMHLILTSVNPEIIKNCLEEFLKNYYNNLTSKMNISGSIPDFSLHDLREEFKNKISYGLLVSFLMFTCITNNQAEESSFSFDLEELRSEKMVNKMYKALSPQYHVRLRSLVLALIDLKLLE